MCGRKNLSTIFIKGAEFSKVYSSSLFLFNERIDTKILIFFLNCTQKSWAGLFSQRPNFMPDWLESSFKSWQYCRGNIFEEANAFFAVVLVGSNPTPASMYTILTSPWVFFFVCKLTGEWGGDKENYSKKRVGLLLCVLFTLSWFIPFQLRK